ncbi:hypothetical protein M514_11349 [Trichuris suis]|uniref:Uncharacterized protein n=1 Tax=Trichuris suis TaxID=68888 RepID=A0A085MTB9_9BILA|nr:hypothetical protein M513_11349 [Trichuris suis]KFD60465.1 hypothetical protein M514_11349 [Trichuris suis]
MHLCNSSKEIDHSISVQSALIIRGLVIRGFYTTRFVRREIVTSSFHKDMRTAGRHYSCTSVVACLCSSVIIYADVKDFFCPQRSLNLKQEQGLLAGILAAQQEGVDDGYPFYGVV